MSTRRQREEQGALTSAARFGLCRGWHCLSQGDGLLQRPKVWQRPWFWIAVAGATAAISGAIIYATYEPDVQTMVGF